MQKPILKYEKIRHEKLYSVGFDEINHRYLLEITISEGAWYSQYYLISEDEYNRFDSKIENLDLLAKECFEQGIYSNRFVCSEKAIENKLAKKFRSCF